MCRTTPPPVEVSARRYRRIYETLYNILLSRYYTILSAPVNNNNMRYWTHTAHARNSAPPINYTILLQHTS